VARPDFIELTREVRLPILYEDRSVLAIDKPPGWMLVPVSWQRTNWNLQAALMSSIAAGHFWARSRGIRFLKYIHRLDAETSGILLLGRSPGAVNTFGDLFESRQMEKVYLAVTEKARPPAQKEWISRLPLAPDPGRIGRIMVHKGGKPAETAFRVVAESEQGFLIEARPYTGRTHQIRVHLAKSGCPIVGDELYGRGGEAMGLRAVGLAYRDPFTRKPVFIRADVRDFLGQFGFRPDAFKLEFTSSAPRAKRTRPN
jgi:RluA family pseudouridine synthase